MYRPTDLPLPTEQPVNSSPALAPTNRTGLLCSSSLPQYPQPSHWQRGDNTLDERLICRLRSLEGIPWMPSLQTLYLQDNQITNVKAIHGAPSLTLLNLAFNHIDSTSSIKSLACIDTLRRLDLSGCPVELLPGLAAHVYCSTDCFTAVICQDISPVFCLGHWLGPGLLQRGMFENVQAGTYCLFEGGQTYSRSYDTLLQTIVRD